MTDDYALRQLAVAVIDLALQDARWEAPANQPRPLARLRELAQMDQARAAAIRFLQERGMLDLRVQVAGLDADAIRERMRGLPWWVRHSRPSKRPDTSRSRRSEPAPPSVKPSAPGCGNGTSADVRAIRPFAHYTTGASLRPRADGTSNRSSAIRRRMRNTSDGLQRGFAAATPSAGTPRCAGVPGGVDLTDVHARIPGRRRLG